MSTIPAFTTLLDSDPLNRYDFTQMRNMWEIVVYKIVAEMVDNNEMCSCSDCVLDTCALALSSLPARYWILGSYDAFTPPESFLNDPNNVRLAEEAVLKAYKLVQKNPHH